MGNDSAAGCCSHWMVLTSDVRKWTAGMKIRQIPANAISGNYSFDMYQTCRTALPASPHLKGAAAEAGRPRRISDPIISMTKCCIERVEAPRLPNRTRELYRTRSLSGY